MLWMGSWHLSPCHTWVEMTLGQTHELFVNSEGNTAHLKSVRMMEHERCEGFTAFPAWKWPGAAATMAAHVILIRSMDDPVHAVQ